MAWMERVPFHLMIIPNTKRYPYNIDKGSITYFEVTAGLPRPYHNSSRSLGPYCLTINTGVVGKT